MNSKEVFIFQEFDVSHMPIGYLKLMDGVVITKNSRFEIAYKEKEKDSDEVELMYVGLVNTVNTLRK